MIPDEKILSICERLLAKSRANRVNWLRSGENRYGVRLPSGGVDVGFYSPQAEPDEVFVSVTNPEGQVVGSWSISQDDDERWSTFFALYRDAERCVTGWDKVLNGIEAALGTDETIGTANAVASPVGDVPF